MLTDSSCTRCMALLGASCGHAGYQPQPGHPAMCGRCGHIMLYGDRLEMRDPSPQETLELHRSHYWAGLKRLQEMVRGGRVIAVELRRQ